jgi:hypothetical protein
VPPFARRERRRADHDCVTRSRVGSPETRGPPRPPSRRAAGADAVGTHPLSRRLPRAARNGRGHGGKKRASARASSTRLYGVSGHRQVVLARRRLTDGGADACRRPAARIPALRVLAHQQQIEPADRVNAIFDRCARCVGPLTVGGTPARCEAGSPRCPGSALSTEARWLTRYVSARLAAGAFAEVRHAVHRILSALQLDIPAAHST